MLFQRHESALTVHAPAKLNLSLQVLGKRTDGFHELETVMVSVGLYDTLVLRALESDELVLQCEAAGPRTDDSTRESTQFPAGAENLVIKAAALLRDYAGVRRGAHLRLTKRIPVAAGLAGGSSDAAATLAGLNRLWELGLSRAELSALAAKLGSDVAFFLAPSALAICRGRGEQIEPVELPQRLRFVIARPRSGLSTALVFQHCQPQAERGTCGPLVRALREGRLGRAACLLRNGLQPPAENLNADVRLLSRLFARQSVLGHLMTGSGTAYFGLCATHAQALGVASRLRAARVGRVFVASSRP